MDRRRRDRPVPRGAQTAMTTPGGHLVLSPKLSAFKRVYRWLNLTLVHQGVWPILLLLTAAPSGSPGDTPASWWLARAAAPALAAVLALLYLRQPPLPAAAAPTPRAAFAQPAVERPRLAVQIRFVLVGLPLMLAATRLVAGPAGASAKLMLFGLADVAAFQFIHFGVVRRSYRDPGEGLSFATILFAASWGLRDALLAALDSYTASPVFALLAGLVLGAVVAMASRALYRWPGGWWSAAAAHWLIVYLVIGFIR
ncbi:MAG: hypothetical protein ACR2OO_07990 [Thermomicrobiales bacterium]